MIDIRWKLGISAFAVVILFCLVSDVLTPFVLAFIAAYAMAPLVNKIEFIMPRSLAAFLVTCLAIATAVTLVAIIIPMAYAQIIGIISAAPQFLDKNRYILEVLSERYSGSKIVDELLGKAYFMLSNLANSLLSSGYAVLRLISIAIVTPIVTFFILKDYRGIYKKISLLVPIRHQESFAGLVQDVDSVLTRYIRGQIQVCLVVGLYYVSMLSLIGLKSAIGIGVLAGSMAFLPYVGYSTALILSLLSQFSVGQSSALSVVAVFAVGGILESCVFTPKLLERHISLSPTWIFFSLMAGGSLFGLLGVMIAIPFAAVFKVLASRLVAVYTRSDYYQGRFQ